MLPNILETMIRKVLPQPPVDPLAQAGFFPGTLVQPIDAPTGGTTLPQPINAPTGGVALGQPPPAVRQIDPNYQQQMPETGGPGFFPGGQQPEMTMDSGTELPDDIKAYVQRLKDMGPLPTEPGGQLAQPAGFYPGSDTAKDGTSPAASAGPTPLEDEKDPDKIVARAASGERVGRSKWWKRALKGALVGSLQGLGSGGGIGGAIGGAVAGAAVEGFYPKSYQNRETAQRVNEARPVLDYQAKAAEGKAKREKAALELEKLTADTEGVKLSNVEKKINNAYDVVTKSPQWKVAMEAKVITKELADYFNQAAGVKLTPANWQAVKDDWVNGKYYTRREFSETNNRNTSLPIKPDEVPREIDLGGGALPLTPKSAAPIIAGQVNADAQREQGARTTNVNNQIEVAKANNAAMTKWHADTLDIRLKAIQAAGAALGDAGATTGHVKSMGTLVEKMQNISDRLSRASDPDAAAKLQKEMDDTQSEFAKKQADFDAALGKTNGGLQVLNQINSVSIPKPNTITAPTVEAVKVVKQPPTSKGGKNNNIGTRSEYERIMKKVRGH